MDHMQLICDIGELNAVFTDSRSIETFLQKIVEMVARHMRTAVCSIYLFDEQKRELILRATKGLNSVSIGTVRMKEGEGLTGLAIKELKPINEKIGKKNPYFKYFPETQEEKFESFLAVPILRGVSKIGVLVVQREKKRSFTERDTITLRAVASQLANMLDNARLLTSLEADKRAKPRKTVTHQKLFKGKVASEGFAHGPVKIINRDRTFEQLLGKSFVDSYTIDDFKRAVVTTELQLQEFQARVEEKLSDVASLIFTAHLLLLKDVQFVGSMLRKMEEGTSPPRAILEVAGHYMDVFSHGSNSYIKEKAQDIEDLSIRLIGNLVAELHEISKGEGHVILAQELFPSDILKLSSENALGVVLVTGGVTSHLSILARSLGMPLVIVDSQKLLSIQDETPVLLDAEAGNLFVQPSPAVITNFHARDEARRRAADRKASVKPETFSKDGTRIRLLASINLLSDLKLANEVKCEGIGLYRSEFPFLIRSDFPSEEEQYVVYRKLVEGIRGKEISFRTLDIGGDKVLSYYDMPSEQNPFLGMRSIRFSLSNRELFIQQLRAMLRAGAGAKIRISFPMISSLEEFIEAKSAVWEAIDFLKGKKIPHNCEPKIGLMIEVPSVLAVLDDLAEEADFFSIGSNDFVQYMLAVDRTNEKVAQLYIPHHPSILRSIKRIVETARKHGIGVTMCGDMAHQERYIPFLLGAGMRELSIEAGYIPRIQELINLIDIKQAQALVSEILSINKVSEIEKKLKELLPEQSFD